MEPLNPRGPGHVDKPDDQHAARAIYGSKQALETEQQQEEESEAPRAFAAGPEEVAKGTGRRPMLVLSAVGALLLLAAGSAGLRVGAELPDPVAWPMDYDSSRVARKRNRPPPKFQEMSSAEAASQGESAEEAGARSEEAELGPPPQRQSGGARQPVSAGAEFYCVLLEESPAAGRGPPGGGSEERAPEHDEGEGGPDADPAVHPDRQADGNPGGLPDVASTASAAAADGKVGAGVMAACFGKNNQGSLGVGDTEARGGSPDHTGDNLATVRLGTDRWGRPQEPRELGCGLEHCCAITQANDIICWGGNEEGELGLGDVMNRGDSPGQMGDNLPTVNLGRRAVPKQVVAGNWYTCALLEDGEVLCWGDNGAGELGLGDTFPRGANPHNMGNKLLPVRIPGGEGNKPKHLTAGSFPCATREDNQIVCWGWNSEGWTGLGDVRDRGAAAGQMGDNLPPLNFGASAAADAGKHMMHVSVGNTHSCATMASGFGLKCWGKEGETGHPEWGPRGKGPNQMGDHLPQIESQEVACFDSSHFAKEGSALLGRGIHPLKPEDKDKIPKKWVPVVVDLGGGESALHLDCGNGFTCAVLTSRKLKCWGEVPRSGRLSLEGLGYGDLNARGAMASTIGDNLPAVNFGGDLKVWVGPSVSRGPRQNTKHA